MEYKTLIDISLPIHEQMLVYPSNPEFTREQIQSASGNTISRITLGTHSGTHIDAPNHVKGGEKGIESYSLETFVGPCRVLDCTNEPEAIRVETLEKHNIQEGERLLFKTQNSVRGYAKIRTDFIYVESTAAEYLANKKVGLVGVDYLSIKKSGLEDNTAHTALLLNDIPIIEGLNLSEVEAGEYQLIALPLQMLGMDGSPIRAVLLKE